LIAGSQFFTPAKQEKSVDRIILQVREGIIKGVLQPNEFLGSEKDLAILFGVSKQTLRETLNALEYMGLVVKRKGPGGGVFISRVAEDMAQDQLMNFFCFRQLSPVHLSELRKILEPCAARAAAINADDSLLAKLEELNAKCQEALERNDFKSVDDYAVEFHKTIARASGNPLMSFILNFVENLLAQIKDTLNVDHVFASGVVAGHVKVYEAIKSGDPELAAQAIFEDVDDVESGLIRLSQNKSIQDQGLPELSNASVQQYLAAVIENKNQA
jgi:GntR family transcriptional repressor for pyruvate dehydrogenase complex